MTATTICDAALTKLLAQLTARVEKLLAHVVS